MRGLLEDCLDRITDGADREERRASAVSVSEVSAEPRTQPAIETTFRAENVLLAAKSRNRIKARLEELRQPPD